MKKIIIILILLSMISVIGCSYDQELIEEQEKIIRDLEKELKWSNGKVVISEEIIKIYRESLVDIKEENDSILYAVDDLYYGYITKSEAIDSIYYHASNIEDILEEFNIK